jgi:predicted DsbA family dithiol-disulfide isomerase
MASPIRLIVPVYYDFSSTICYVSHQVMKRLAGDLEELGIDLRWQPLDLTRITAWSRGDRFESSRRENALRISRDLGVSLKMPGVPTFMLDEWPIGGIQEDATMRSFLRRWAARKRLEMN